jgi:hypothetical protein
VGRSRPRVACLEWIEPIFHMLLHPDVVPPAHADAWRRYAGS